MKKAAVILALASVMLMGASTLADDEISLNINDTKIESDVAPQIIEGRTMVPLRAIFEGVGADVSWDGETKSITGTKGTITVKMSVDSNIADVNGIKITMDKGPVIIEGRTLAPARYVAEAFGCNVEWDKEKRAVNITTPQILAETTTETTTEAATEATTFETTTNPMYSYDTYYKSGTYVAGSDIPQGEYAVFSNPYRNGYLYKYAVDGELNSTGRRYLYAKYFDYCDIVKLDPGNHIELINSFAVPYEDAHIDANLGHNGTYKAGKDIKAGHLTFKLSPKAMAGYVDVGMPDDKTEDKTLVHLTPDHDSVIINVRKGMYIKLNGCDILDETLKPIFTYEPYTQNYEHTDSRRNFGDITPAVKRTVDDFLTILAEELNSKTLKSTKYQDAYSNQIAREWKSMAKNKADEKYVEIGIYMYNNIRSYAYGTNGDLYNAAVVKMNGKEMSGTEYREIFDAQKKMITDYVAKFKNASNFEELEVINKNFTDYRLAVPRLNGSKVS